MTARPATSAAWLATAVRLLGVAIAIAPFLPPVLERTGHSTLALALDRPWASMCHRMPERSLVVFGEIMPICSRCLGLVEGLGLGLAFARPWLGVRGLRIAVSIAAALLFVELTTQDLGWHPVFHPTRLLTGFLCAFPIGAAAGHLAKNPPVASDVEMGPPRDASA